ncbi:hypothetical protein B0H13DRAFT_1890361 [Mycena leptocephala]|nr:hypothetical protein B0H13DRAFT_1890361 [Mycena leptocephala]
MSVLFDGLRAANGHHPISFTLAFQLAKHSPYDVVLGLDWAAFIRDSMLNIGYRLDSTFNAALWVSDPAHPLSHDRRVSSSSLFVSNGASVVNLICLHSDHFRPNWAICPAFTGHYLWT